MRNFLTAQPIFRRSYAWTISVHASDHSRIALRKHEIPNISSKQRILSQWWLRVAQHFEDNERGALVDEPELIRLSRIKIISWNFHRFQAFKLR